MSQRSRTEYSMLNIATGVGGYGLSVVLSLINRMVFTRCLPAAYLGISGLFSNILGMLSLAELGVSGAIVYALYKPLAENDEEKIASLVRVFGTAYRAVGTFIGLAGVCLLPVLHLLIGEQPQLRESIHVIYLFFLFAAAGSYFFTYRSTLLVAAQKNYLVTGITYLFQCILAVVQAVFLYATRNYMGYLVIQVSCSMLTYICISRLAVKQYPYITRKDTKPLESHERKKIFRDMRDLMAYNISGVLVNSTDNIIITYFSGLITTGLASNYTLLTNTLNSLLRQIFNGIGASVGNLNAVESQEKKFSVFKTTNLLNFWVYSWGTVGILFVSSDLVGLLFGEGYALEFAIPAVLALNFYTVGMQNAMWTFKHTMGLFRYGRFVQMFTAGLNLIFSIALGRIWGLFGIFFATFLARLMTNLWYDPYVIYRHAFGKNPLEYLKKYGFYLAVLMIEILLCQLACGWICISPLMDVLCKGVLVSLISNGIFFLLFSKSQDFDGVRMLLDRVRRLLFRR